jgi:hypothetical protein
VFLLMLERTETSVSDRPPASRIASRASAAVKPQSVRHRSSPDGCDRTVQVHGACGAFGHVRDHPRDFLLQQAIVVPADGDQPAFKGSIGMSGMASPKPIRARGL